MPLFFYLFISTRKNTFQIKPNRRTRSQKTVLRSVQVRCMRHGILVEAFYPKPRFSRTANKRDQAPLVSPGKWTHRTIIFYIVPSNNFHVARQAKKTFFTVMFYIFELSNLLLLLLNMFYLCFELSYDCPAALFLLCLSLFLLF